MRWVATAHDGDAAIGVKWLVQTAHGIQQQWRVFNREQGCGVGRITQGHHLTMCGLLLQPLPGDLDVSRQLGRFAAQSARLSRADDLHQGGTRLAEDGFRQPKGRQKFAC